MDVKTFLESLRERGQCGALFPIALGIVLVIGVMPELALGAIIAASIFSLGCKIIARLVASYEQWRDARNPVEPRFPIIIYRTKRRY